LTFVKQDEEIAALSVIGYQLSVSCVQKENMLFTKVSKYIDTKWSFPDSLHGIFSQPIENKHFVELAYYLLKR